MAHYKYVYLDFPEAELLADLNGVYMDLISLKGLIQEFRNNIGSGATAIRILDAFTTAILVRYARIFKGGVRKVDTARLLKELNASQRENHEKFIAWRDKHIAHSVNAFEENRVQAYYDESTVMETGLHSIGLQRQSVLSISQNDLTEIVDLADTLLKIVSKEVAYERERVLEIAKTMPVKELLAKGDWIPDQPGMDLVSKRRK